MSATIIPFPTQQRKEPSWDGVLWLTIRRQRAESRARRPCRSFDEVFGEIQRELETRDYGELADEIEEACNRY